MIYTENGTDCGAVAFRVHNLDMNSMFRAYATYSDDSNIEPESCEYYFDFGYGDAVFIAQLCYGQSISLSIGKRTFDCSVIVIDSYNGVVYTVEVIVSKNQTNWMFRALSDLSPVESFYYLQNSFQLIPYR